MLPFEWRQMSDLENRTKRFVGFVCVVALINKIGMFMPP